MKDCLFCKIINNEIPSKKIYEDDKVLVIMDINPKQNGDLLVILKRHAMDFNDLTDEEVIYINKILKDMEKHVLERLKAYGFEIITNVGKYQDIKHYHVHLTPGYETEQPIEDLDVIYDKLK